MRTLLVLADGPDVLPWIEEAHRLKLRVLVAAGAPDAPAFRRADAGLLADSHDVDAMVEAARAWAARHGIAGVVASGPDAVVVGAAVADALELPGLPLRAARLAADPPALRAHLRAAGVPVPSASIAASADEVATLAAQAVSPLLLRPLHSGGDAAALRLLPGIDAGFAFALVTAGAADARLLVEPWIPGPRCAVVVTCGTRPRALACADVRHAEMGSCAAFVVETGRELPSALEGGRRAAVDELAERAVAVAGLSHGIARVELVVGPSGPLVLDVVPGLPDALLALLEVPLALGVPLAELAIRNALGEAMAVQPPATARQRGIARRYVLPAPGHVHAVQGAEEVATGEGVVHVELSVRPGDRVPAGVPGVRAGAVLATGETREEAGRRAEAALARLRVLTSPVPLGSQPAP